MESPLRAPDDPGFRLIETMLWTPRAGIARRARHMARLARSAARFGIAPRGVDAALDRITGTGPLRVRLTVDRHGGTHAEAHPFTSQPPDTVWTVAIAQTRLTPGDPWLGVKTTERALYDAARAQLPEGVDEWLFLNDRDALCEGTITNLFVQSGDTLLTPPLSCGVLPGILREDLLDDGQAREAVLTLPDLRAAPQAFVGNALRGLIRLRLSS